MSDGRCGQRRVLALVLWIVFSILFFAEACLRASQKYFWFDELCSLAIVQLPTFAQSWQAVLHGADYNPPLFYLIMRWTFHVLGDGLIAQRVPAMAGIWCFCSSLLIVAWRRCGIVAGVTAFLFPLATVAGYYAVEARPHAIVLGFIGIALLCWHMLARASHSGWWLAPFSVFLLAALFTHCYAVLSIFPFAAYEFFISIRRRAIRWPIWTAIIAPIAIAAVTYIPLLRAYRVNLAASGFGYQFRSGFWQLPYFYATVLTPAVLVLVGIVLLLAKAGPLREAHFPELGLSAAFVLMPIAAVLFCLAIHGPFISRYFLATVAGFALILALRAGAQSGAVRYLLPAILLIVLVRNGITLLWHHVHGQPETMVEPVLGTPVNTTPGKPLARFQPLLTETGSKLPIMIAAPMDFLYLVHYAPQLRDRLYYVAPSKEETNYKLYSDVRDWCHLRYNAPATYADFLPQHPNFYIWGDPLHLGTLSALTTQGAKISQWDSNSEFYLAKLQMIGE